jgi:hypothetical protein
MTKVNRISLIGAAALAAAGCGQIADHSAGRAYSMADLVGPNSVLPDVFTPRGAALSWLAPPFAQTGPGPVQASDADGLTVFAAFVDAHPAAYVTTEVWDEWTRVWAEPMYVPVTSIDPIDGPTLLEGARPVFSVAPPSKFYAPFWQTWYVIVPEGTKADAFTSVAQVLDSKLPLAQGPNVFASISVPGIGPAHADGQPPVRPLTYDPLVSRLPEQGWLDGKPIWVLTFGPDRFRIDDKTKLVQETVLYQFALRGPDGLPIPLDLLPRVGGTGAFRAPRPVDQVNGIPQFGALWHEFQVIISPRPGDPTPGVFVPKAMTALRAKVAGAMGDAFVPAPGQVAEDTVEKDQYILRVALDSTCFGQGDFPNGCVWLDTQANIENNLPGASFVDTKRLSARALLLFDGIAP